MRLNMLHFYICNQDGVSFFDHESYSKNNRVLTVTERGGERRRLLPHSGVMRSLILRITDSQGGQPKNEKHMLSDLIFGSHKLNITSNQNSMVSIFSLFIVLPTIGMLHVSCVLIVKSTIPFCFILKLYNKTW